VKYELRDILEGEEAKERCKEETNVPIQSQPPTIGKKTSFMNNHKVDDLLYEPHLDKVPKFHIEPLIPGLLGVASDVNFAVDMESQWKIAPSVVQFGALPKLEPLTDENFVDNVPGLLAPPKLLTPTPPKVLIPEPPKLLRPPTSLKVLIPPEPPKLLISPTSLLSPKEPEPEPEPEPHPLVVNSERKVPAAAPINKKRSRKQEKLEKKKPEKIEEMDLLFQMLEKRRKWVDSDGDDENESEQKNDDWD